MRAREFGLTKSKRTSDHHTQKVQSLGLFENALDEHNSENYSSNWNGPGEGEPIDETQMKTGDVSTSPAIYVLIVLTGSCLFDSSKPAREILWRDEEFAF